MKKNKTKKIRFSSFFFRDEQDAAIRTKFMMTMRDIKMPNNLSAGIGEMILAAKAAAVVKEVMKVAFVARE
jgi:hypothetical protein